MKPSASRLSAEIDDQPIGFFQRKDLVLGRGRGIEHQAGVIGCRPQAHTGDLGSEAAEARKRKAKRINYSFSWVQSSGFP